MVLFIFYFVPTIGVLALLIYIVRNKESLHALAQTVVGQTFEQDDPRFILAGWLGICGILWIFILAIAIGPPIPVPVPVVCPSRSILASRICHPIQPGQFTLTFEVTDHFECPGPYRCEFEVKKGSVWVAPSNVYLAGYRYLSGTRRTLEPHESAWPGTSTLQITIY